MNFTCCVCTETYSTEEMHGFKYNNKSYCEMCEVPTEHIRQANIEINLMNVEDWYYRMTRKMLSPKQVEKARVLLADFTPSRVARRLADG